MSEEDDEERSLWVVSGDPIAMMDQPFDFNYSESFYLLSGGGGKIELIMICLDGESEFFCTENQVRFLLSHHLPICAILKWKNESG
jgi:hypothetical protein